MPPTRNTSPPSRPRPPLGLFRPRPCPPIDRQTQISRQGVCNRQFPSLPKTTGQDSSGYAAWAANKPIAIHLEGDLEKIGDKWSHLRLANDLPSLRPARENTVQAAVWYIKYGPRWGPGREVMEVLLRQPMLIFLIYIREVAPALQQLAKKQQRAARKEQERATLKAQKVAARRDKKLARHLRQQEKRRHTEVYESPDHTEIEKKTSNPHKTTYGQMFLARAEFLIDWVAVDEKLIDSPEQRACRCQIWNPADQIPVHSSLENPFPDRGPRICSHLNILPVKNPFVTGKEYTAATDESQLIITRGPIGAPAVNATRLDTTPLFAVTPDLIDLDIARQIRDFRKACLLGNDPYETQRALTLLMSRKGQQASATE